MNCVYARLACDTLKEELEDAYVNTAVQYSAENKGTITFAKFLSLNNINIRPEEAMFLTVFELNSRIAVNAAILNYFGLTMEELVEGISSFDPQFRKTKTLSFIDLERIPRFLSKPEKKKANALFKKLSAASLSYFKFACATSNFKTAVKELFNDAVVDLVLLRNHNREDPGFVMNLRNKQLKDISSREMCFYVLNAIRIVNVAYATAFDLYSKNGFKRAAIFFEYVYNDKTHVVKFAFTPSKCCKCNENGYLVMVFVWIDGRTYENELCNMVHVYSSNEPVYYNFSGNFRPKHYGSSKISNMVSFEEMKVISIDHTCCACACAATQHCAPASPLDSRC